MSRKMFAEIFEKFADQRPMAVLARFLFMRGPPRKATPNTKPKERDLTPFSSHKLRKLTACLDRTSRKSLTTRFSKVKISTPGGGMGWAEWLDMSVFDFMVSEFRLEFIYGE